MKSFSRWLLGSAILVVVVLAVGGTIWFMLQSLRRPALDINKVGGTILVCEVDQEKSPPGSYQPDELAAALKRRLDPADLYSITVRPAGDNRLEIVLPRASDRHDEDVRRARDLLARAGILTFVILANSQDDDDALQAATNQLADPELRQERELAERKGQPPPPPQSPAGQEGFASKVPPGSRYTYRWVELSAPYRFVLGLNNAQEQVDRGKAPEADADNPAKNGTNWRIAAEARKQGKSFDLQGHLYCSRKAPKRAAGQDQDKKYEYFVLVRDPEKGQEITGQNLSRVDEQKDQRGQPAVGIRFNATGAERFRTLTSNNQPTAGFKRGLAIVLDDEVMSAPSINGPIGADAVFEGQFTKAEVQRLVSILRAGALPAQLKPVPVAETEVLPAK